MCIHMLRKRGREAFLIVGHFAICFMIVCLEIKEVFKVYQLRNQVVISRLPCILTTAFSLEEPFIWKTSHSPEDSFQKVEIPACVTAGYTKLPTQ